MNFNLSQQIKNLKIFEIGNVFISRGSDNLPVEKEFLAGLWTGLRNGHTVHQKDVGCDFFDIKGSIEGLFLLLEIHNASFTAFPAELCSYTIPGRTAKIMINGKPAGLIGELSAEVLSAYDLKQQAFIFELDHEVLLEEASEGGRRYKPVPKFPATARDITVIIPGRFESGSILETVSSMNLEFVESVNLYDLFEGAPIPEGRKSVTLRVTYRSGEKTLEDSDVKPITEKIAEHLINKMEATLPG
jgi:phenylalanyl-tRNA synthetase beta chain